MRFSKKCGKPLILGILVWFFKHIDYEQAVMRGPMRVQRKESEKHPFRGTPKKPEKCQFLTDSAQNIQFSSFPEKNKNITCLHSLRLAFKIREIQYAVLEKCGKP